MPTYTEIIVCTPGSATDNAYTDLADSTKFFANTLRAATWEAFSQVQRERALIQATQEIEDQGGERTSVVSPRRTRFPGAPYYSTSTTGAQVQSLHFPRSCDARTISGVVTLFVPQDIVAAVCEQAFWLLAKDAAPGLIDHEALKAAGISSISTDGTSISYGGKSSIPAGIAPLAWAKLKGYIRTAWGTG